MSLAIRNAADVSYAKPFEYIVSWKSSSLQLGDHRGTQRGMGLDYRCLLYTSYPSALRLIIAQRAIVKAVEIAA